MNLILPIILAIIASGLGVFCFRISHNSTVLSEQLNAQKRETGQLQERLQQAELLNSELNQNNTQLQMEISQLRTLGEQERKQATEKIALLMENKEQLKLEFQNLANKIFEEKSQKFTDQNQQNITNVLTPLREQMTDFKKRIEDVYDKESKDRRDLFNEINNLKDLNQTIGKEALNLTKALKGESKTRGNWGEVVLERVLEESGLQNGREYETQASLKDQEGKRYQPDVIVHLPEEKDIVIDSKVSLNAYERFNSAESDEERAQAFKEHIASMRGHIKELSAKNYDQLEGIRSLDFVLMFVPIESAFLAAVQQDATIFTEAYKERIVIVSPSTLLVTLRTIQNIWRNEYQNKNAQEIARQAGNLYDQCVLFVDSLDEIGKHLGKTQGAFDTAYKRLTGGRGNLIKRTEDLKKLGIAPKKSLPQNLIDEAAEETALIEQ